MKKFLSALAIILLLVIFQTSLLAPWFGDYFYPDLLLVFVVSVVAIFGFQSTWSWIVLGGLIMDLFAYSRIGTHVIIFMLSAYAISFVSRRFSIGDRGLGLGLIVVLMPFISLLGFWGVPFLNGISPVGKMFSANSFYSVSLITLENLLLFFIFYPTLLKLKKRHNPSQFRMGKWGK